MKAQVVKGSKEQIAETVVQISGDAREAIVFIQEPSDGVVPPAGRDIFAEMEPFLAKAGGADYSREMLYSRMSSE